MEESSNLVITKEKREAQFRHYKPKRWHPEFDLMVIDSVAGKSNEEIGRRFGYTKQQVSNILSTEEAASIKERIRNQINKEFDGTLKDRISNIGKQAVEKIEKFISDDAYFASKPFEFVDRALKIAQATQTLASDSGKGGNTTNNIVNGNAIIMNVDQSNNLRSALDKSMELDSIRPGDQIVLKEIPDNVSIIK